MIGNWEVERIDVGSDSELVIEHQVQSVPTILLLKNGQVVWKHLGTISETELTAVINANLIE